jgi:hypothetical protein
MGSMTKTLSSMENGETVLLLANSKKDATRKMRDAHVIASRHGFRVATGLLYAIDPIRSESITRIVRVIRTAK